MSGARLGLAWAMTAMAAGAAGAQPAPVVGAPASESALEFELPGLEIGTAEYAEGPTGATVFHFPRPVMVAVDVRGGSPGTINSDTLRLAYDEPYVDAITFAGGSSYGLSVATGVAEALRDRREDPNALAGIATVAGAIIFDLGSRRFSSVTPDGTLARAALDSARAGWFPQGPAGAGRFATQGGFFDRRTWSGQGGAFRQAGPTRVAVFTVVNALGHVVDREGRVVRCAGRTPNDCGTIAGAIERRIEGLAPAPAAEPRTNTTLTLVVTNQRLPVWALQRLAMQVHMAMGRAIQPYATTADGDVLFAATTGEVENPAISAEELGLLASEAAWDAVLASVPPLDPPASRGAAPDAGALARFAGRYEFAPGAVAEVAVEAGRLTIMPPDRDSLYLPGKEPIALEAVGPADFIIAGPRGDRLRFEQAEGRVSGLTINPGRWPVRGVRLHR